MNKYVPVIPKSLTVLFWKNCKKKTRGNWFTCKVAIGR